MKDTRMTQQNVACVKQKVMNNQRQVLFVSLCKFHLEMPSHGISVCVCVCVCHYKGLL